MGRLTKNQWLFMSFVLCAGFAATLISEWDRVDAKPPARTQVQKKVRARAVDPAVDPLLRATAPVATPKLDLDHLGKRDAHAPAADLFESRGWAAPREKPVQRAPAEPAVPQPPPVPFVYLGKWTERDQVVVLLAREGRNYLAHVDEVLDETYHVDSIEANRLLLTYMPLNVRQTLAFEQAGRSPAGAAPAQAQPGPGDVALHVMMPPQAAVAEEFTILLSLDPQLSAAITRGTVELVYDPKVLNVTVAGTTRIAASSSRPDPGRFVVELGGGYIGHGGPATAVRLRVVTESATTTQIRLASLSAFDIEEHNLPVAVDGANPRSLTIVQASKTK